MQYEVNMTFCVERLVIPLPPSTFKWMRIGGSSQLPTPHVIPRLAQVALLGALMFFSIAVFTFAKPEQEERVWRSLWHCAGWSQGWRNSKIRVEKSWYIARCHSERHYNDMNWHNISRFSRSKMTSRIGSARSMKSWQKRTRKMDLSEEFTMVHLHVLHVLCDRLCFVDFRSIPIPNTFNGRYSLWVVTCSFQWFAAEADPVDTVTLVA